MKEGKNIVERVFKSDECTSIWKYDLDKSNVNPISEPSEPIKNHEQIILFELRDLIKNTK